MPDTRGETSYFAPSELGEALGILGQQAEIAVLAGGTALVPKINYGERRPEGLLYIGKLGLDYVKDKDGTLLIGAATPVDKLLSDPLVAAKAPVLVQSARLFASFAVRTSATVGGNIANGSPAADLIPPLIALDASLRLASTAGERMVAVQDFCTGPCETRLQPGELILEIVVPPVGGRAVFLKLGRRKAQTLAVVNVAVRLEMDGATCQDARIALGAVAPTPLRCTQAETLIRGKGLDTGLIADCAARAIAESAPITDQRGSAWYRKEAGAALVARALTQAAALEG
jgi:aerobic carbon-monoxide dehydrogenase medium subunit